MHEQRFGAIRSIRRRSRRDGMPPDGERVVSTVASDRGEQAAIRAPDCCSTTPDAPTAETPTTPALSSALHPQRLGRRKPPVRSAQALLRLKINDDIQYDAVS
jgi:hypothetical protein